MAYAKCPTVVRLGGLQHVEGHRAAGTQMGRECLSPTVGGYPEHLTAMRAFSLVLVVVQIVEVALANGHYWPISGCQITVDNYGFDLCPLLGRRNNSGHLSLVLHHQTPPTITTIVYNISLNGPLRRSDDISGDEQVSLVTMYRCGQV